MEKKKGDVIDRLRQELENNPELKAKIEAKVRVEFSALDIIHSYLRGTHEFNERHMMEFAEFCIKETLKNQRYLPSSILFGDWLNSANEEDRRALDSL